MNASIISRRESLSMSVTSEYTSQHTASEFSSNSERNSNTNNNTDIETSENTTSAFSDTFEYSKTSNFSEVTYNIPVFQRSKDLGIAAKPEGFTIAQSKEELNNEVEQKLTDYYGIDTEKHNKYRTALDKLETFDPELAQKAMFLITLLGNEEADKFLSDISEFTSSFKLTQPAEITVNTVAHAESATLNSVYESMLGNVRQATERYAEVISERFDIEFNLESVSFSESSFCDPLIFDLDGDGINLSTAEDGVQFDIDGNGKEEQTAFIRGDDALLYLDSNNNGVADSGKELFGDQHGDANGFDRLAKYDENNDGKIDEMDEVYSKLRLWQDKNADGVNQESESISLLEAGIKSIKLMYNQVMNNDGAGNITAQTGEFTRTDGSSGYCADMLLRTHKNPSHARSLLLS